MDERNLELLRHNGQFCPAEGPMSRVAPLAFDPLWAEMSVRTDWFVRVAAVDCQ
jgi:hypothetical protein